MNLQSLSSQNNVINTMMNCSFISWVATALLSQIALKLEDRKSIGASGCTSGDGTDQRVQSLMFMMMTNIQVGDIHTRLIVHGVVKGIAKKGDS